MNHHYEYFMMILHTKQTGGMKMTTPPMASLNIFPSAGAQDQGSKGRGWGAGDGQRRGRRDLEVGRHARHGAVRAAGRGLSPTFLKYFVTIVKIGP